MRQVLCPVLIGREEEVHVLLDALDGAAGGHGSTLVAVGEAGVGKSRLVHEVSRQARSRGMAVLTGRAVSGGVTVALRPLAEAVLGGLRRHGDQDPPELRPFRPALGRLVPEWLPPEPVPGAESPVVLGEGVLRLLRVLGDETGCLLVLEDLHWADSESLAVLEYLADNLAGERIVCLGTLRADGDITDGDNAGRELIRTLAGRRAARTLELSRLDDEAGDRMARACLDTATLPAEVAEFLRARAEGLPFLVEELLAGLVGAGLLVERDGHWSTTGPLGGRVPPSFADTVGRRLAALPAPTRGVLHAAALLGRRFDWSLLPAVTDLDDAAVVDALRQAVGAQLVTAEADAFRFRHALTRDAVLGDLVPPERARLAGRVLAAVEQARPELPGAWCELAAELAEATAIGRGRRSCCWWRAAGRWPPALWPPPRRPCAEPGAWCPTTRR